MSRNYFLFFVILFYGFASMAQQTVRFIAEDGVEVTADHYVISTQKPYLILLHREGSSRGEYREIAPKLANLGFNCLAVDLRVGNEEAFIKNQTHLDAKVKDLPISILHTQQDIKAAIHFVAQRTSEPILLMGSSYSASLGLIEATHNFKVKGVVAFSPSELPGSGIEVKEAIQNVYVPILALGTKMEYTEMAQLLDQVKKRHLTLFKPTRGEGAHGAPALWESNPNHKEYWMVLTQFFSLLQIK